MNTWQPIETAPRDGTDVLVFVPADYGSPEIAVAYCDPGSIWQLRSTGSYAGDGDLSGNPTHWMPKPAAPGTVEPRKLGSTPKFCLHDAKTRPAECMVAIAAGLNGVLEPAGVRVAYVNILNPDPESEHYNPDGLIGHFQAIQL